MIVIGEKLNSSIPSVKKLMDAQDRVGLTELVLKQRDAGAEVIDINTALCNDEIAMMTFLCDVVIDNTDCGIMVDSPNPAICEQALDYIRNKDKARPIIINSITVNERHECIELAKKHGAGIVVLLTDENGIPDSGEARAANARAMMELLNSNGFSNEDIYIDIIAESVAVNGDASKNAIDCLCKIREFNSDVHILCGLSNISFGLPKRAAVNSAFMAIAVYHGMDSVICDPLSEDLKKAFMAAEVLNGNDDFCMEYIDAYRG